MSHRICTTIITILNNTKENSLVEKKRERMLRRYRKDFFNEMEILKLKIRVWNEKNYKTDEKIGQKAWTGNSQWKEAVCHICVNLYLL